MDTDSNGKIDFEEVRISIFPFIFMKEQLAHLLRIPLIAV